ncbi:hypothetical protein SLE2022_289490 [Rubroshorea leprosula]
MEVPWFKVMLSFLKFEYSVFTDPLEKLGTWTVKIRSRHIPDKGQKLSTIRHVFVMSCGLPTFRCAATASATTIVRSL